MRRRVCVQDWQRELRMVKAVQKQAQKMASEPNHEARRDCPLQQQGIYGSSGIPIESLSVTVGRSRVVTRYDYPSLERETDFFIDRKGIWRYGKPRGERHTSPDLGKGAYTMDIKTICIHGSDWKDPTGCISVPVFQSATFGHPELGQSTGYDYARVQNPTRECAEKVVARLEHGCDCTSYSSGMAAISMVMELFKPGDTILSTDDLYGGSIRLFRFINEKNGLHFRFVDTSDISKAEAALDDTVKAIYIETPTNPMMQVTDIREMADLAHSHGALLIADNTFMSPYFCNPIDFGADIVLHSGTKYLAGHNDTLAGFVVCKNKEIAEKIRFLYKTVGGYLAPWDSWLVTRGIKTLALRMEAAQKNAQTLAEWLADHPKVTQVLYPGLARFKNKEIHDRQSRGTGAMLSFYTDSHETALRVLKSVRLIRFAESLGGVESLITYPATQTHTDLTEEERESRGITACLLRLSVGIEDVNDLIADLSQALGD